MVRDALHHYGNNDSCTAYTYGEDEGDMLRMRSKESYQSQNIGGTHELFGFTRRRT
ncbi:MAG: hypothetical protein J07HQX50_01030 [Haloquadratum sp. J07HQX50]|nr:MAG: hypothetical protein J07HQX50_01030 [Haloquadratum sp. J07HQX50]